MGDLNKDDLYNMFKSYENNVKYNIQLYDRQEALIKEQGIIVNNLALILDKQSDVARSIETLIKSLVDHNTTSSENIIETKSAVVTNTDKISGVSDQITKLKIDNIKGHGELKTGLIVISVGLSSVVIALIVALGKIWEKSDIIDSVAKFIGAQ